MWFSCARTSRSCSLWHNSMLVRERDPHRESHKSQSLNCITMVRIDLFYILFVCTINYNNHTQAISPGINKSNGGMPSVWSSLLQISALTYWACFALLRWEDTAWHSASGRGLQRGYGNARMQGTVHVRASIHWTVLDALCMYWRSSLNCRGRGIHQTTPTKTTQLHNFSKHRRCRRYDNWRADKGTFTYRSIYFVPTSVCLMK